MVEKIKNKPANNEKSGRWKKGQSGNPKGRPKDGESWATVIKDVSNMTADDIIKFIGKDNDLGRAILQLPKNVQMKYLVVARVMAQLMFEPSGGLWNSLMERAEGRVPQKVGGDGDNGEIEIVVKYATDGKATQST